MGLEIQVNSLEEMCDLMCNNILPKRNAKENKDSNNKEETEKECSKDE